MPPLNGPVDHLSGLLPVVPDVKGDYPALRKNPRRRTWNKTTLFVLPAAAMVAMVVLWGLFMISGQNGNRGNRNSEGTLSPDSTSTNGGNIKNSDVIPQVLIVLSADKFWFSDYGPLIASFSKNQIKWTATSNRTGTARFDPSDRIGNKQNVAIQKNLQQIANSGDWTRFDAIVFMGNNVNEFIQKDDIGEATGQLLTRMQAQDKWIASIGKGSTIPFYYGAYDDAKVANSEWILESVIPGTNAELLNQRVVIDPVAKCITANSWLDASDFADALVKRLLDDRDHR